MSAYTIRAAGPDDADALNAALRSLSQAIGDTHAARPQDLVTAGFGAHPAFSAQIAETANSTAGAVVYSPVFSTTLGTAGLYASDLWVAEAARGTGLGRKLLGAALADAREKWGARFIRLTVYHDNSDARAFYERLGFVETENEQYLLLKGTSLDALDTQT